MSAPSASPVSPGRVIVLLLLVLAVHQAGGGLVTALVPMRLAADGFAASVAGAVSTAFSIGFLLGCLASQPIVARLGRRRAMAACAGVNALCALAMWVLDDPISWSVARAVGGFAIGTLFALLEAWLAASARPERRGAVFGAYMVMNRIMFTAGQVVLTWVDPRLGALFAVSALIYLLSPLPALWIGPEPPRSVGARPPFLAGLLELPRQAPAAAAGSLAHALLTTVGPALYPIYAVSAGLPLEHAALGLAAIQFGGLCCQLASAFLADRFGRRPAMAAVSAVAGALSLLVLAIPTDQPWLLLAAVAAWGGVPAVLYAIAAAHANDVAADGQRLAWASCMLFIWGVGAALSPILASALMDLVDRRALFAWTAVFGIAFSGFLMWRQLVRKRPPSRASVESTLGSPPDARG
ncbi:MAG: MFS transporter [Alphaproteobacteria bacterium]|nr:MFS transporter [Alphaproteobacteria bacterium]